MIKIPEGISNFSAKLSNPYCPHLSKHSFCIFYLRALKTTCTMNSIPFYKEYLLSLALLAFLIFQPGYAFSQKAKTKKADKETTTAKEKKTGFDTVDISGLKFRSVGPALTSGRISEFAVDPKNPKRYFV